MDIQKDKEELIEMFGIHFETLYHLPPLASRILGIVIVDSCRNGITFENLIERTAASKSSVSTNLNLLLKLGKVTYFTLAGDRKKYYRPAPFSERLKNYQRMLEFEKKLIDKMLCYRERTMESAAEICDLENAKAYKHHVLKVEELLEKTIEKFREIEEMNKSNQQ